ncbi:ferritin light chain-like [Moschus berezovskii]|uniref:ferritin light chain-like n=1 Tax=Moschus berezovskii TaxID=68408 RepID=UPI0024446608|nr:ferritin light chain-like [Moschus berezovskii]
MPRSQYSGFIWISPEAEAILRHLADLHLQACHTCLSLGSHFNRKDVARDDLGKFFGKLALEMLQGADTLSQMQRQSSGPAPFLEVEKLSQDEWDPRFCRLLEVYFLDEVVKVIRKTGDHLTGLYRPTGPRAGQGQYLT